MTTSGSNGITSGRYLVASAALSNLGDGVQFAALPLLAYSISVDPLVTASVAAARVLPVVMVALPISALLERCRPKIVMEVSLAVRAATLLALCYFVFSGLTSMIILLLLSALLGIADAAFDTTSSAAVVDSVVPESRHEVNGALSFVQTFGLGFVGPVIGAVLFDISNSAPFAVNAVMLVVAAVVLQVRFQPAALGGLRSQARVEPMLRRISGGIRACMLDGRLRSLLLLTAAWNVFGWIPEGVLVLFVQRELGEGPFVYSLVLVATAAGSLFGAVASRRLAGAAYGRLVMLLGTPLYGLAMIPIAFANSWVLVCCVFFLQGLPLMMWSVAATTYRQNIVPREDLVRVNALFYVMSVGLAPVGLMLGPVVAHFISVRGTFVVAGLLLVASGILGWLSTRRRDVVPAEDHAVAR